MTFEVCSNEKNESPVSRTRGNITGTESPWQRSELVSKPKPRLEQESTPQSNLRDRLRLGPKDLFSYPVIPALGMWR